MAELYLRCPLHWPAQIALYDPLSAVFETANATQTANEEAAF